MSTLMTVLLYMHNNEAQLWNHSTSVIRISISEQNKTLEIISSTPLTSDKKAEAPRKQSYLVADVWSESHPQHFQHHNSCPWVHSKYLFDISHHVCFPLILSAILLAIKNLQPSQELCCGGTPELTAVCCSALILKVRSMGQEHQHHLETC